MNRRDFMNLAGSAVLAPVILGCSRGSGGLVATPEKRADYLKRVLESICAVGPHPIGSPEYAKAAEIFLAEMKPADPSARLDSFTYERWRLLAEPEFYIGDKRIETYPGHGTSGTPEAGITGILKEIEDPGGIPYGIADRKTGKVGAWVSLARHDKAVPLPYYSFQKEVKCLPTLNIGLQDVPALEEAIKSRTPVRVKSLVEFIPNTSTANVVGELPGESDEEILFLAHLDTVYNTPGANDNTASAIAMLLLMHRFSGKKLRKPMTFVATNGEEYNKLGAIDYAERRKREGTYDNIKYLVNLDSITWGPNMQVFTGDEEVWNLITEIDRDLGIPGDPVWAGKDGFNLDGRPFRDTGAKAVYMNSRGYDNVHVWHRPEDTPETVPVDCVEIFYRLFEEYVLRVQRL
ncbi:M28 family peptidase [candidate division KSB1 bacterium]